MKTKKTKAAPNAALMSTNPIDETKNEYSWADLIGARLVRAFSRCRVALRGSPARARNEIAPLPGPRSLMLIRIEWHMKYI